jgi:hypothetical protein
MADADLISKAEDPKGRLIVLDEGRWDHIKRRHPEMTPFLREIMDTVRDPDQHFEAVEPGEDWYFRRDVGPSRWIRAVVGFAEAGMGRIRTAHGQRSDP